MTDAAAAVTEEASGALRASSVVRWFTGVQALRGVSIELHRHEVVGLIGPNGAGKSTLVNVLTGFDLPSSGSVELAGRGITRWSAHRRARAGLTRTFQHSRSFRDLTVRENVEVAALGVGAGARQARQRADELLELVLGLSVLRRKGGEGRRPGRIAARRREGHLSPSVLVARLLGRPSHELLRPLLWLVVALGFLRASELPELLASSASRVLASRTRRLRGPARAESA